MKKKRKKPIWLWLVLIVIALAAIFGAYYLGMKKGSSKQDALSEENLPVTAKESVKPNKGLAEPLPQETPGSEQTPGVRGLVEPKPIKPEDECKRLEEDVREFFRYLDERNYVQHLEEGIRTHDRFKAMIHKLSSRPPIPAGEGIDSVIMTGNIYHFFRALGKNDLRLIKEVLRNEADTLEMNLDLFYRWLMLGDRCPDPDGIRPSLGILYKYAGFFLNTIGGRSYLFRRPAPLRLLVSYYCLLIIHEADKKGLNSYGLDISPELTSLQYEMELYSDFLFQNEYIRRIEDISNYYLARR